jgi:hypothetical protein
MTNAPYIYRTTAELFRYYRSEGDTAKLALSRARFEQKKRALPVGDYGGEYDTDDGFTVRVEVEPDHLSVDDAMGDCFGEIRRSADISEVRNAGVWIDDPRDYRARSYSPSSTWTFQDRVAHASKQGMSRHNAWLDSIKSLQDEADAYERLLEQGCLIVTVTVERDGEEYASDCIAGVEDVESFLADGDMVEPALERAREQLAFEQDLDAREQEYHRPDMYASAGPGL